MHIFTWVLVISLCFSFPLNISSMNQTLNGSKSNRTSSITYPVDKTVQNSPNSNSLVISNNTDLLAKAYTYGWQGNGTKTNPILVKDLALSGFPYALEMENTSLWVKVSNLKVFNAEAGILLSNVQNLIFNNISISNLYDVSWALEILGSNNVNITEMNVNSPYGSVLVSNSSEISIKNSFIEISTTDSNSDFAISIRYSHSFSFSNNSIAFYGSKWEGNLAIINSSSIVVFQNNWITNTSVYFQNSDLLTFDDNFVVSNGLSFDSCTGLVLKNNIIFGKGFVFSLPLNNYPVSYTKYLQMVIVNNTINKLPFLYLFEEKNTEYSNCQFYQALVVLSTNIAFNKCQFTEIDVYKTSIINITQSEFTDLILYETQNTIISNNKISGTVVFSSLNNLTILNNTFFINKEDFYGIYNNPLSIVVNRSSQVLQSRPIVTNNTLIKDNVFQSNIDLNFLNNASIIGNSFSNLNSGITPHPIAGIILYWGTNIHISDNNLSNNFAGGMLIVLTKSLLIDNNTIQNNYGIGLRLESTNNTVIKNNKILKNTRGIVIENSENISLSNNDISEQYKPSVVINSTEQGYYDSIYGYGIYIVNSKSITITNNVIRYNSKSGIYKQDSSNITLSKNTIEWNGNQVHPVIYLVDFVFIVIIITGLSFIIFIKKKRK